MVGSQVAYDADVDQEPCKIDDRQSQIPMLVGVERLDRPKVELQLIRLVLPPLRFARRYGQRPSFTKGSPTLLPSLRRNR